MRVIWRARNPLVAMMMTNTDVQNADIQSHLKMTVLKLIGFNVREAVLNGTILFASVWES